MKYAKKVMCGILAYILVSVVKMLNWWFFLIVLYEYLKSFWWFSNHIWRWDGKHTNQFFRWKINIWNGLIFSPLFSISSYMLIFVINNWCYLLLHKNHKREHINNNNDIICQITLNSLILISDIMYFNILIT